MEVINEVVSKSQASGVDGSNSEKKPAEDAKPITALAELADLLSPEVPKKDEKLVANLRAQIPDINNIFNIHRKIGHGTFSSVFLGTLKCHERLPLERKKLFAIKHVVPTSHPSRIERELKCMLQIGGTANVVGVELCLRRQESVAFVMPYIAHDQFHQYYDRMSAAETRDYMRNLLVALRRVHEFNVIHRDVKPSNFLYNRKQRRFLLVDFGLAQDISKTSGSNAQRKESDSTNKPSDVTKRRRSSVCGQQHEGSQQQQQQQPKKAKLTSKSTLDEDNLENRSNMAPAAVTTTMVANAGQQQRSNGQSQPVPNGGASSVVFKTPLKQSNQIVSPLKLSNITKDLYSSPLLIRQVKSTVLGVSSNLKARQVLPAVAAPVQPTTTATASTSNSNKPPEQCDCFGKSQVCNVCLVRKEMQAARAGTPGYRPPEVLLKYPDQGTVVDIWAAGVMFLSILSRCYPFFRNSDDLHSLAEIITVFGDQRIKKTAAQLGRHVKTAQRKQPLDLRKLCLRLRFRYRRQKQMAKQAATAAAMAGQQQQQEAAAVFANTCDNCQQRLDECLCEHSHANRDFSGDEFPDSAYDLLRKLLEINPHHRISAEEALKHPFFSSEEAL